MERQRSFAIVPTKLLLFSFTVSFSTLFCFLFSFWVFYANRSGSSEVHVQFVPGIRSLSAQRSGGFNGNLFVGSGKNPILGGTHVGEHANLSGVALDSIQDGKGAILVDAHLVGRGNLSRVVLNLARNEKDVSLDDAHFSRTSNSSKEAFERNGSKSEDLSTGNEDFETATMMGNRSSDVSWKSPTLTVGKVERKDSGTCDVSNGRWVFDESYPLYTNNSCPFIDEGFSCETNGRMDRDYMKWRWQPYDCEIPRFDPVKMLEMIRGKRLVFVGDSINRNQWESMLCMLRGAISDPNRVKEARGRRITKERGNYNFKFMDYQCSVEYYVSHFLVHESKAKVGQKRVKTLRIDSIDRSSSRWRGADILVFNTAHWWTHHKTKAGVNYYQEGSQVHPKLDVSTAFRKALTTWASWVDRHVSPERNQVFFRSSSPSHFSGGEWNSGGHCKESTRPLNETSYRHIPEKIMIVEEVVKQMKCPVTLLNITSLSGLRIDGHPSTFGRKPENGQTRSIQDCSHWCLPGVPDTWNELLYFHLLSKQKPDLTS